MHQTAIFVSSDFSDITPGMTMGVKIDADDFSQVTCNLHMTHAKYLGIKILKAVINIQQMAFISFVLMLGDHLISLHY